MGNFKHNHLINIEDDPQPQKEGPAYGNAIMGRDPDSGKAKFLQAIGNALSVTNVPVLITRTQVNSTKQPLYVGYALSGTGEDEEGWFITKMTYSGGVIVATNFSEGEVAFDKVWDDRATYTYS